MTDTLLRLATIAEKQIEQAARPGKGVWPKLWSSQATGRDLDAALHKETLGLLAGRWIPLPLADAGWRPLVWIHADFGQSTASFQVMLVNEDDPTRALGFRFETPQPGPDGAAGLHHYHHLQLSNTVRVRPLQSGGDISVPGMPGWLPKSFPTFPIPAAAPAELALCLLLSIYGFGFEDRLLISDARIKVQLAKHYSEMACAAPIRQKSLPRTARSSSRPRAGQAGRK